MIALINSSLGTFLSFVLLYKYGALFIVAFLAAAGVPLPASTTLAAASAFASQGFLNIWLVLLVALAGNVAGDLTLHFLARLYGEKLLRGVGLGRLLTSKLFGGVREYLLDFPQTVVYFTRFLTEAAPITNILSGLIKMPLVTFVTFDVLGEASYVALYGVIGYLLGSQWENNISFLAKAALIVVSIGVILNVIQVMLYKHKKKSR